ncbi:hypothetical protein N8J89_03685 [Crossiella sp. CA-258035]|uniref:hypothetical protein n=1 Tax=Crossiella sp. CA-258035 TaxID=2981138 RepID=UPI0024BD5293|nr:hypothetical protein [Crossiella sp. CA-258035]WHT20186.1 hypothetical protein N8J89_03685 [Crossiella sp. CA-258035]
MTSELRRDSQADLPRVLAAAVNSPSSARRPLRSGLPVAPVNTRTRVGALLYLVTPIDQRGRLADRSPLRALGWEPGRSISISVTDAAVIVVTGRRGAHTLTRQGHLRLPASVRHQCGLATGDRLLVVALTGHGLLVAYTPAAVSSILAANHGGPPPVAQR